MGALLTILWVTLVVGSSAMTQVALAFGISRLVVNRWVAAWQIGAGIFLILLWFFLLFTHAGLEYWVDQYPEHEIPWELEFARGVFENLQSEDWQIWLAALCFAHYVWKGTPESKE